jgi:hypothetical protein
MTHGTEIALVKTPVYFYNVQQTLIRKGGVANRNIIYRKKINRFPRTPQPGTRPFSAGAIFDRAAVPGKKLPEKLLLAA